MESDTELTEKLRQRLLGLIEQAKRERENLDSHIAATFASPLRDFTAAGDAVAAAANLAKSNNPHTITEAGICNYDSLFDSLQSTLHNLDRVEDDG